jgi:two-component system heavy metal sensor histidine kinase CusS
MTAAAKHEPSTMASTTASASASATGLRQRMSCWLALQAMLGLGLVCGVVYLVIATTLTERQDDTLDQKQAIVRHLVADERATHEAAGIEHTLDDFLAGHENLALRLQAADGGLWYDRPTRQGEAASVKRRSFELQAPAPATGMIRAELSLDTRADDLLLSRLAITLAASAVIGALVVSVGGFWLVHLGLQPLHLLVEQTRRLTPSQVTPSLVDSRLDGSVQPQELQPLIGQFNALLDRLALAYQQMEGFNADVAHELNTPLASLISGCELALRKSRDVDELREVLGSNLEDLQRMAGIVSDMLFLSNADRGVGARRSEVPSLAALVGEVIEFHDAAIQEAGLGAEVRGDAVGQVDARLLRRAVSNLLGNATRHATPGSTLLTQIERLANDKISISVINQGPNIAPDHLPRLFDRFYRADPARAQADRHHGLGLSIVAAIARMHDGQAFASSHAGVTRMGLMLGSGMADRQHRHSA